MVQYDMSADSDEEVTRGCGRARITRGGQPRIAWTQHDSAPGSENP